MGGLVGGKLRLKLLGDEDGQEIALLDVVSFLGLELHHAKPIDLRGDQDLLARHEGAGDENRLDEVRRQLEPLRDAGIESLAICLLHAFVRPDHELLVEQVARELGFQEISLSSRVAPLVKIVSRGDTTVADAYLNPVLRRYVQSLRAALG